MLNCQKPIIFQFGALDATAHESIAQKFGIRGFPTIKFFAPGTSSASDAEDYQGGRTSTDLISYAESKYDDFGAAPEVVEGTGKAVVETVCKDKQLCIFTFLPSIFDCQSKCRKQKIDMLNELATIFKKRSFGWVWMEGGAQENVQRAFEIGDYGFPVLIAMSPKKMMYSTQIGQFSVDGIKEFLNAVNYGKGRVLEIKVIIKIHQNNFFLIFSPRIFPTTS